MDTLLLIGAALVALVLIFWILSMRRIVELKYVDVVVNNSGSKIYTADATVVEGSGAVYYEIPFWIPLIGCIVKRMPLEIIQIAIENYDTFAKENARFIITVSVYCRINNVTIAAQRFPGQNINDFKEGMSAIIVSAVRKTTANYAIEDIISKRKEIGDDIREEIKLDFERWGVELTNVAVETISDAKGTTVIHDISAKKESQINSLSRQTIAAQEKQAAVVEAENRQTAETRKIEADEQIGVRAQQKDRTIAEQQQTALQKQLEVERTKQVTTANIEADAKIKVAEGTKQSTIIVADGQKSAIALEGAGQAEKTRLVGVAEADVIQAKKVAEANGLSALADAQKKQQESAKDIRLIEKDQAVGLALADALKNANIKYIGSGQPKNFMDLFTVQGGISTGGSVGSMLEVLKESDPTLYTTLVKKIESIGEAAVKSQSNLTNGAIPVLDLLTKENIAAALALIRDAKPDVYKELKKTITREEE